MTSTDEGKTWSESRVVEVRGLNRREGALVSPALAVEADGLLRLYFECRDEKGRSRLLVAASKDGKAFENATPLRFEKEDEILTGAIALNVGKRWVLLGQSSGHNGHTALSPARDDRLFDSPRAIEPAVAWRPLSVVPIDGGLRLYASTRDGIVSAICKENNLHRWTPEKGVRLSAATSGAVVRLKDGRYLMIAARPVAAGSRSTARRNGSGRESTSSEAAGGTPLAEGPPIPAGVETDGTNSAINAGASDPSGVDQSGQATDGSVVGATNDPHSGIARTQERGTDGNVDDAAGEAEAAAAEEQAKVAARAAAEELGIPYLDFQTPIDFMGWMKARHEVTEDTENSYDYYRKCMPPDGQTWGQGEWPLLVNMFADTGYTEPPGPWHPGLRPDWETVYQQSRSIMANYAEAGRYLDFVRPIQVSEPKPGTDEEPLIFSVLLPDLSGQRALIKQAFGDAWRAGPDGKVDGNQMLYAIETGLNAAEHVSNGDFLIEKLVGVAEKNLIHENARWALQHEILTPDQIQHGLEMLMEKDRPQQDPLKWVQGEAAAMLDMTQYAFGPIEPGREPKINPERLKKIVSFSGDEEAIDMKQYEGVDPHQTSQSITSFFKEYVELSRQGYPSVKARDLDALVAKHVGDNPLAKQFVPSLSRVYTLNQRNEASRRATQLTYAIHLHKARTGSWPTSLDDLPAQYTSGVRTDPFNGQDFRYRLTTQGPMLYSASENGVDDGGTHHVRWGEATPDGQVPMDGDDYVFWPPQRR